MSENDYDVIIPAYNASQTIADAIASILTQTALPHRIIVVDDGSTDDTVEVVARLEGPITLVTQSNQGPGAATNVGLLRASAQFFSFLDADDIWTPDKAAVQLNYLSQNPDTSGCFSYSLSFRGPVVSPDFRGRAENWGRSSLMIRSEAAHEIGMMLTDMPGQVGEVVDWVARGRHLGQKFHMLDEALVWRRIRRGSLSYSLDEEKRRGYLLAARRAMERRRNTSCSEAP